MSARESDSWYLDPLVAEQKAAANLALVSRWAHASPRRTALKTDLFEEANGEDHILRSLAAYGARIIGLDHSAATVARARRRFPESEFQMAVADLRAMNFRSGTIDFIVSTSTLDHFDTREQFLEALRELHRVLSPGGRMVLLLDNPLNPGYWPLRLLCHRVGSFGLGYTMSRAAFRRELEGLGLRTIGVDYAIHNPRMVSTLLFLALRRVLRSRAEPAVRALVRLFDSLGKLPTSPLTACFSAVCVEKPGQPEPRSAPPDHQTVRPAASPASVVRVAGEPAPAPAERTRPS